MEELQAYCLRCKSKQAILDPKESVWKNGTPVVVGKCAECGSKLNKIMKKKKEGAG